MIPGVPHHTITADEQAAILAAAHLHPSDLPRILCGTPAWVAIDALRHAGRWVTWAEWLEATARGLWLAGAGWLTHAREVAYDACRDAGYLVHRTPEGRAVALYEIEDRRNPRAPWRCRARTFTRVHHPPLAAARWIHVPEPTRPRTAAHVGQLSLLEAAA